MIKASDLKPGNYVDVAGQRVLLSQFWCAEGYEAPFNGIPLTIDFISNIQDIKEIDPLLYRLEINLPYPGNRFIEITKTEHKWIAYYMVNDVAGSTVKYFVHELQNLFKEITGIELIFNE